MTSATPALPTGFHAPETLRKTGTHAAYSDVPGGGGLAASGGGASLGLAEGCTGRWNVSDDVSLALPLERGRAGRCRRFGARGKVSSSGFKLKVPLAPRLDAAEAVVFSLELEAFLLKNIVCAQFGEHRRVRSAARWARPTPC